MSTLTATELRISHTDFLGFLKYLQKNEGEIDGVELRIHGYGDSIADIDADDFIVDSPYCRIFEKIALSLVDSSNLNVNNAGGTAAYRFICDNGWFQVEEFICNYEEVDVIVGVEELRSRHRPRRTGYVALESEAEVIFELRQILGGVCDTDLERIATKLQYANPPYGLHIEAIKEGQDYTLALTLYSQTKVEYAEGFRSFNLFCISRRG